MHTTREIYTSLCNIPRTCRNYHTAGETSINLENHEQSWGIFIAKSRTQVYSAKATFVTRLTKVKDAFSKILISILAYIVKNTNPSALCKMGERLSNFLMHQYHLGSVLEIQVPGYYLKLSNQIFSTGTQGSVSVTQLLKRSKCTTKFKKILFREWCLF